MRRSGSAIGASAVLLALTLSGHAQDRKTEPAAAPAGQQDKIEITDVLDSWYKVVQPNKEATDEKSVGFIHERLAKAQPGSVWRFQYDLTGEIDVLVPAEKSDKLVPETHAVHIRAHLDDTYTPVYMERHDQKGAGMLPTTIYTEENIRKIDILYSGERKSFTVNPDEEVFYAHFLMFIALRQSGALSKPGTRKAMLLQPREDGQPPYAEVQIDIKDMVKRDVMGKKGVSVTPILYLKPPPAASKDDELLTSYVDKYGRIVEEESRRGTRRVLVKTEKEALGDRPLIVAARRDPFWKEGAFGGGPRGPGDVSKGVNKPSSKPDQFQNNLQMAKKLIEDLIKCKQENRKADGDKIYDQILDLVEAMFASHLIKPLTPVEYLQVEQIQKQAEDIWGGVAETMKKAQLIFVRCTQLFDKDDCAGMEAGLKELKALLNAKPIRNLPPKLAEIQKWASQIEPLVARCKTRLELGRKKLVLTGTTLSESWDQVPVDVRLSVFGHQVGSVLDVRFVRPVRIAILNGKPYRLGDLVEGEGVRIEKIWAHGVQVSLRDETRDVGIRQ